MPNTEDLIVTEATVRAHTTQLVLLDARAFELTGRVSMLEAQIALLMTRDATQNDRFIAILDKVATAKVA